MSGLESRPPDPSSRTPAVGSSVRRLRTPDPIDLHRTVGVLRHGPGDPTFRRAADGTLWRAVRTPVGPVTIRLSVDAVAAEIVGQAWGSGAAWALETLPDLLGARDNRASFAPGVDLLDRLHRRFTGWRLPYTGLVFESLVPAVIEQKVTGGEAFASYRQLVGKFGEPAPGPGPALGLMVHPEPVVWTQIPVWEFHLAGLGPQRRDTLVTAAGAAPVLERAGAYGTSALDLALRALPGVGVWTSAEVRQRALADADAVSIGDAHIAHTVSFALTGRRGDDEAMLRALSRWRGHRYRVSQLLAMGGARAPRYGPRYAPLDHRAR